MIRVFIVDQASAAKACVRAVPRTTFFSDGADFATRRMGFNALEDR